MTLGRVLISLVSAALAIAGLAPGAWGRSTAVLSYAAGEVWPTAVRFLRIDRGYGILEKDVDSGYVLFEILEGSRKYRGALELVRITDDHGRDAVKAVFSLPDLPRHWELMLLDKLGTKLKEERGSPAPPPTRKPPEEKKPPPDGGR